jgi:superfamily II DNA or RNA helicase
MINLFDYQEQALAAEARHRQEHPEETRLAIVMATGLGKGMIIAARAVRSVAEHTARQRRDALMNRLPRDENNAMILAASRVLILAPTEEIVTDLAARCRLLAGQTDLPISVGIVMNTQDETDADIVVASVQTLLSPERRSRIRNVGLVIADECELYAAPEWRGVLAYFGCFGIDHSFRSLNGGMFCAAQVGTPDEDMPCAYSPVRHHTPTPALGFTATLRRGDGQGLGNLWQDVCFTRDISWGVRHGYLVQPVGHRLEIDLDEAHPVFGTDTTLLDRQLIDSLAPARIVEKWQELAADRPTIAFMPLVRSARELREAFRRAHVRAEMVWGDMPKELRRSYIARYNAGDIQVLVNAMVLTRGFDAPKTSCVIIGRPTKSVNLGVQMAGRGLRRVPGIPVEEQDCILIYVQDATSDLFCHADLSDRPMDRKATGALTVMEDQWDIGKGLEDEARHWTGKVDVTEFDPLVRRSSKVWKRTKGGTLYLPIGKDGRYVFVVGTSVFIRTHDVTRDRQRWVTRRLHKDLPDIELALQVAEDEATDRGGDVGALLADRDRAWRKGIPSAEMQAYAQRLGLGGELIRIMEARAGGKAGKLSDLISMVEATRALDPMVIKIKEKVGES